MRAGWLLPGLILLLIVGLLLFIPLPYPEGRQVTEQQPLILFCPQVLPSSSPSSGLCLTGSAPESLGWTGGNSSTWVELVLCKTFSCTDVSKLITPGPKSPANWAVVGRGASGTFNFWVPTNDSLIVFTNSTTGVSVSVTLNSMPEFHLLWEVFAVIGMVLAVVGILLPRYPRPKRRIARSQPRSEPPAAAYYPAPGATPEEGGASEPFDYETPQEPAEGSDSSYTPPQ